MQSGKWLKGEELIIFYHDCSDLQMILPFVQQQQQQQSFIISL